MIHTYKYSIYRKNKDQRYHLTGLKMAFDQYQDNLISQF